MNGDVSILNVGSGDTKLSFDPQNPAECIRAARIVKDMLRRGYALLIEVDKGRFQRVHEFDENACEYIIADFDPEIAAREDNKEIDDGARGKTQENDPKGARATTRGRLGKRRIKAARTRAVAVGRSAGG